MEKIVTQEVIKEVPVEKIVTQTQIKEVQVEKIVTQTQIKEVQVDRVVTQIVEKVVEAPPAARTVKFNFETDHTSGPRGKSTQWAIDRYNQIKPNTIVKFIAQPDQFTEKINIQAVAGTLSEISLLSDRVFQQWVDAGTWLQINDLLAKNPDFTPAEYHFSGEVYTDNKELPGPLPYDDTMRGAAIRDALSGRWNRGIHLQRRSPGCRRHSGAHGWLVLRRHARGRHAGP